MSGAVFVYPSAGNFSYLTPSGLVNIFDTLEVAYTSTWDALNLTLFCKANDVPTDYQVWQAPYNPITASGTFRLESIYSVDFTIYSFPTWCSFKLTQYGNDEIARGGESFQVVSVPGTSTTYRSTVIATTLPTPTLSFTTTTTQSSTVTTVSHNSSASQTASLSYSTPSSYSSSASVVTSSILQSTIGGVSATTSSTSPTVSSKPIDRDFGASTGLKAGTSIGLGVLLLAIAALCFLVFRLRKKVNRSVQEDSQNLRPELPAYTVSQNLKPAYVYGSYELEQGSRVELPIPDRNTAPIELQGSKRPH